MLKEAVDNNKAIKEILSNGLTYYLIEEDSSLDLQMHLLIHAGSSNDAFEKKGLARLLEHMCLVSLNRGDKERITSIGSNTSFDETLFSIILKPTILGIHQSMHIFFDIINGDILDESLLTTVRFNNIHDWDIQKYSKYFIERNTVYSKLLPSSLCDNILIGEISYLKTASYNDLLNFHSSHYTIDRSAIIITGNFNHIDMESIIREYEYYCMDRISTEDNKISFLTPENPDQSSSSYYLYTKEHITLIPCSLYIKLSKNLDESMNPYSFMAAKLISYVMIDYLLNLYFNHDVIPVFIPIFTKIGLIVIILL